MHSGIILFMASKAIRWGIAENLRLMAFLAFHFHMQTEQREMCPTVIDLGILPAFFVMAGITTLTQLLLMHIVFFVAGNTIKLQLLLIQFSCMARRTFNLFMLAL